MLPEGKEEKLAEHKDEKEDETLAENKAEKKEEVLAEDKAGTKEVELAENKDEQKMAETNNVKNLLDQSTQKMAETKTKGEPKALSQVGSKSKNKVGATGTTKADAASHCEIQAASKGGADQYFGDCGFGCCTEEELGYTIKGCLAEEGEEWADYRALPAWARPHPESIFRYIEDCPNDLVLNPNDYGTCYCPDPKLMTPQPSHFLTFVESSASMLKNYWWNRSLKAYEDFHEKLVENKQYDHIITSELFTFNQDNSLKFQGAEWNKRKNSLDISKITPPVKNTQLFDTPSMM